jgi:glycogen(starch) synthase
VWDYSLELANQLSHYDIQVSLATIGPLPRPAQRRAVEHLANVSLYSCSCRLEWMDDPWDDVDASGHWLMGLAQKCDPDLIHLNGYCQGNLSWSAPTLIVAHSCVLSWWESVRRTSSPSTFDYYRERVREGLTAVSEIVAPSRAMLGQLHSNYGWTGKGSVIPNGRDAKLFRPGDKEAFVFSVGRLWDEAKNLSALDEVAPMISWPMFAAGDVSNSAGQSRKTRNIRTVGFLDTETLAAWYSRASIYALPARYEPFGLTVLEAALSGCALVLGDVASLRENWGGAAVFVQPDDRAGLASAILSLIDRPDWRMSLAIKSRERAKELSSDKMARGYLDLYSRMLRSKSPT